jgi:hypothetical protein
MASVYSSTAFSTPENKGLLRKSASPASSSPEIPAARARRSVRSIQNEHSTVRAVQYMANPFRRGGKAPFLLTTRARRRKAHIMAGR